MKSRWLLTAAIIGGTVAVVFAARVLQSGDAFDQRPLRPMVTEGETAPLFSLEAADGTTVSLGDYKGEKRLAVFQHGVRLRALP